MPIPIQAVETLVASITGNVSDQEMKIQGRLPARSWGGSGIEAGIYIDLGTATTADVTIKDANGKTIYSQASIVADTVVAPAANGVRGPLKVTVANISNAAHTLSVYVQVRV